MLNSVERHDLYRTRLGHNQLFYMTCFFVFFCLENLSSFLTSFYTHFLVFFFNIQVFPEKKKSYRKVGSALNEYDRGRDAQQIRYLVTLSNVRQYHHSSLLIIK